MTKRASLCHSEHGSELIEILKACVLFILTSYWTLSIVMMLQELAVLPSSGGLWSICLGFKRSWDLSQLSPLILKIKKITMDVNIRITNKRKAGVEPSLKMSHISN